MYKEQQATSYKDQYLLDYDQIDVNGYALSKDYYNLIIHNEVNNNSKYITILTDKGINYQLQIQAYDEYPCPRQCTNNGYCMIINDLRGLCKCDFGWIDEDCSIPAQLLLEDQHTKMKQQRVYYNGNSIERLMELTITTEIDQNIKIYVQTRKLTVFYPNEQYAENVYQVNSTNPINIYYRDQFPNTLIIYVNKQDMDKVNLYLNEFIQSSNKLSADIEKESNKLVIIIIIILFVIIGFISIYYIYQYLNKSTIRKQQQKVEEQIIPTFTTFILKCERCSKDIFDKEIQLNCNHHFHANCWNQKDKQCPICVSNICELVD